MTILAEFMIIACADNYPPMLKKSLYDSWKSHMELYIENQENERMIHNSLQNGPLVWPTVVEEDGTTRAKKYEELSIAKKLQADYDLKATNIVLQGLPPDVYAIVNHHKVAKEIWDRFKLLMQGTKLSLQEKECKLYDEFDKFSFVKGETIYHLPPEWSKFVTDVKLARDLYTTNYDRLYSYLEQHEAHANETCLTVPVFNQGDDLIACLNKAMAFLTAVASSRFPLTNNQLRTSFNPRNQATIQNGRVTAQQPKRPRNAVWFKEKAMLADAQEVGQILDEEQLAFLTNPGIPNGKATQTTIPNTAAFQTKDLDAYDSDCQHVASPVIDDGETLIFEEVSRSKMLAKQNDPMSKEKKVNITPINYIELNQLSNDFGKRFVPQQELSDEQAFWLQTSHPNTNQFSSSPVKIEAPKELPKVKFKKSFFLTTALQSELRRLKGKHVLDNATIITNATIIAPGMFKLDIEPLSHRLKNNMDAHEDYMKKTIENTNTIRGLVERTRKQNPSEPHLDYACKFTKHVQELSQPTCNKKNDTVSQKPSSNSKNKVEAQPRKVNKKNHVKESICDVNVKHTMLNVNSQLIFVKCYPDCSLVSGLRMLTTYDRESLSAYELR
ncbi:hypothetical protein Tco_1016130 [Tanacetum coccineum]|uniref:Integrase, catalytic region, zinc finger, CCHC-type, peptidase aspartic, catalytic n=1 Tax=Tanacetum coccineum TaxID=301880 RepID=A0ABQ5FP01_9ASTR